MNHATIAKTDTLARVIPALMYVDAPKAIDWLCDAFGFEKYLIVPGENNTIAHAELVYGNAMVMLGSSQKETEYAKILRSPKDLAGCVTQGVYVIVDDAQMNAHYDQAKSSGAEIVIAHEAQHYGGSSYTCRDLEGNLWTFGSYNPWQNNCQ